VTEPVKANISLAEGVPIGGVYANGAIVWDTPHEFTLDFTVPPRPGSTDLVVVTRVRIPVSAMFNIVQTMSTHLGKHEDKHGRLTPPPVDPLDRPPERS